MLLLISMKQSSKTIALSKNMKKRILNRVFDLPLYVPPPLPNYFPLGPAVTHTLGGVWTGRARGSAEYECANPHSNANDDHSDTQWYHYANLSAMSEISAQFDWRETREERERETRGSICIKMHSNCNSSQSLGHATLPPSHLPSAGLYSSYLLSIISRCRPVGSLKNA